MDKAEARGILDETITELRRLPYVELEDFLTNTLTREAVGASGAGYQMEIQAIWDDRKRKHLRVMVAIDDGGWSAYMPMTSGFIIAPDGSFIGEEGRA